MAEKLSRLEFERRVYAVHGDRYDIKDTVYKNRRTKITVLCNKHGYFDITPQSFMSGGECPECSRISRAKSLSKPHHSFDEEIERMKAVQGDRFDYIEPQEYRGVHQKIEVVCNKCGAHFFQTVNDQLNGVGCPQCKLIKSSTKQKGVIRKNLRKPVCGIGMYDLDEVAVKDPVFCIWKEMIKRCYGNAQKKRPTYKGCEVCNEWLLFSNYKKWYNENYKEGFDVDKDLFGGKLYSPDSCCFLPPEINIALCSTKKNNRGLPTGVYINNGCITACAGKKYLGSFKTIHDAFDAYVKEKKNHIDELAEKWKDKLEPNVYIALKNLDIIKHFKLQIYGNRDSGTGTSSGITGKQ